MCHERWALHVIINRKFILHFFYIDKSYLLVVLRAVVIVIVILWSAECYWQSNADCCVAERPEHSSVDCLTDQCWLLCGRAARAQQCGLFADEIVAMTTKLTDKDGNSSQVVVCCSSGTTLF